MLVFGCYLVSSACEEESTCAEKRKCVAVFGRRNYKYKDQGNIRLNTHMLPHTFTKDCWRADGSMFSKQACVHEHHASSSSVPFLSCFCYMAKERKEIREKKTMQRGEEKQDKERRREMRREKELQGKTREERRNERTGKTRRGETR